VVTHENRRALFYDDLLRGKTVAVHFLATRDTGAEALASRLSRVQPLVADRLGRDLYLYSITTDPLHDTPSVLEAFARRAGARPGWLFLTGHPETMELLKSRCFAGAPHAHHGPGAEDCSLAMLRYGNEAAGVWGSAPVNSTPQSIAERLASVRSRPTPEGPFRRRGPSPLRAGVTAGGQR